MKSFFTMMAALAASILFSVPVSAQTAQETCGKKIISHNPRPGVYQQVSPNEVRNMKNVNPLNQKDIRVVLEPVADDKAETNGK